MRRFALIVFSAALLVGANTAEAAEEWGIEGEGKSPL